MTGDQDRGLGQSGSNPARTLAVFLSILLCPVVSQPLVSQGPPPAGIRLPVRERAAPLPKLAMRQRGRGSGTLLGAVIGGAIGAYLGKLGSRPPGPGGGDGLGKSAYLITIPLGVGVGALVGYIAGDQG